jgi:ribosomal protein L37AE/L43A
MNEVTRYDYATLQAELAEWKQLRPEECPDCGCRSISLVAGGRLWNCDGCKGRWYGHSDDLYRQLRVVNDRVAAMQAECERLREALQTIAESNPKPGLYHGGETYYGLNERMRELAKSTLKCSEAEVAKLRDGRNRD